MFDWHELVFVISLLIRKKFTSKKQIFLSNLFVQREDTLECDIDHTVGLFGRFSLFHTCIDQKVHHVVYYSHLDSHVV